MKKINKLKEKGNIDTAELAINIKGAIEFSMIMAFTTGMICMVACDKKTAENQTPETVETEQASNVETKQASNLDIIVGNVEPGSVKTFDVGEHVISVRIYDKKKYSSCTYAINNTPEGYEVFDVDPVTGTSGYSSVTAGYDIWFKNTEPVEVEASYNDVYENYGYYTFGKVIEKEKVLEK